MLDFIVTSNAKASFLLSISSVSLSTVSSKEQEITVNVNVNDLPSESYFRVAWQESSGSTYFGYMKNNNSEWVKIESSQDCKNYYKVSDLSTTSISLTSKIGDENSVNNSSYLIKVRRYTASCSSYTDSDSSSVQVSISTPTPTPTATPTPMSTATPTSTPTATSTPSPTPTKTPTPKPTKSPTPTPFVGEQESGPYVLGAETTPTPSPLGFSLEATKEASASGIVDKLKNIHPAAFVLVFVGLSFLGFAGYGLLKQKASATIDLIDEKA